MRFSLWWLGVWLGGAAFGAAGAAAQMEFVNESRVPTGEIQALYEADDTLYLGVEGRLYYRPLTSDQWEYTDQFHDPDNVVFDLKKHGHRLFASTLGAYVFETTDGGSDWSQRAAGFSGTGSSVVICLETRGDSLYAGTAGAGIFVMPMQGNAVWSSYNSGLPSNYAWDVLSLVNAHGRLVAGAGISATVYLNDPHGASWTERQFAPFIPTGLGMLGMAAKGDTLYGGASDGLYISVDTGKTWTQYLTNVGIISDASLAVTEAGEVYAVVTRLSASYLYKADRLSWQFVLSTPGVVILDIESFANRLYAGTFSGLWYLPLDPTGIEDPDPTVPSGYLLAQNYPNPFNPSTTISFSLAQGAPVYLEVVDLLGRRVVVLVDEVLSPGQHVVEWNGRTDTGAPAASGVYFYRITAGELAASRKMMLLK